MFCTGRESLVDSVACERHRAIVKNGGLICEFLVNLFAGNSNQTPQNYYVIPDFYVNYPTLLVCGNQCCRKEGLIVRGYQIYFDFSTICPCLQDIANSIAIFGNLFS